MKHAHPFYPLILTNFIASMGSFHFYSTQVELSGKPKDLGAGCRVRLDG